MAIKYTNGQFSSKMLRRLLVLLTLSSGLIATCHGDTIYRNAVERPRNKVTCTEGGNMKGCIVDKESRGASSSNQSGEIQTLRDQQNGFFSSADVGEATKITMLYIMIHAVAAIAGKALIVAKVALAIATAIALKKSLEHHDKVSYEIIKHPHHSYVQTHSSSVDYDHHSDFGESGYGHRKRRRILR